MLLQVIIYSSVEAKLSVIALEKMPHFEDECVSYGLLLACMED